MPIAPNNACTPLRQAQGRLVGRFAVRVFRQFARLGVGSVKVALSRLACLRRQAHQRVPTPAGRCAGVLRKRIPLAGFVAFQHIPLTV